MRFTSPAEVFLSFEAIPLTRSEHPRHGLIEDETMGGGRRGAASLPLAEVCMDLRAFGASR